MGRLEQLVDEDRSDGTDYYATAGSKPTRQSGALDSESAASQSPRPGMRWVFIIQTSSSFFLGESSPRDLGTSVIRRSLDILSRNDTSQKDVTGLNQSNK